ncbi:hypothetical protein NC653_009622 [Populus alba x Populus x berolinensis]|uniref:Uncharacterized protein n=1 Tax=Populus alba x Populus x berolinensis TaxID=444605 RepID=A0AAD6WA25_9ROSI|nr:hypothetical protein NC653_009622 [Populus alba x Populus x berolinensis]
MYSVLFSTAANYIFKNCFSILTRATLQG